MEVKNLLVIDIYKVCVEDDIVGWVYCIDMLFLVLIVKERKIDGCWFILGLK